MNAAAEIRRPARDRKEEVDELLGQMGAAAHEHFTELARYVARLWESRSQLSAILRDMRDGTAWQRMPDLTRARLDSFVCDALFNLRSAQDELRDAQGALTGQYLEESEQLERELFLLLGFTEEQIEEAKRPPADPAANERARRAAAEEERRRTAACPHGVLLAEWRHPCEACRQERETEQARLELEAQMRYIRSKPVESKR